MQFRSSMLPNLNSSPISYFRKCSLTSSFLIHHDDRQSPIDVDRVNDIRQLQELAFAIHQEYARLVADDVNKDLEMPFLVYTDKQQSLVDDLFAFVKRYGPGGHFKYQTDLGNPNQTRIITMYSGHPHSRGVGLICACIGYWLRDNRLEDLLASEIGATKRFPALDSCVESGVSFEPDCMLSSIVDSDLSTAVQELDV